MAGISPGERQYERGDEAVDLRIEVVDVGCRIGLLGREDAVDERFDLLPWGLLMAFLVANGHKRQTDNGGWTYAVLVLIKSPRKGHGLSSNVHLFCPFCPFSPVRRWAVLAL